MKQYLWSQFYRHALNIWPCIRGTGGRIYYLSSDFTLLKVKIPLNWRTRNRVGTIYGGSMYGATDPFFMLMLMEILGKEYVVWDKAGTIRFKRPGTETLYTEFYISPERLGEVHAAVEEKNEGTFTWQIQLKTEDGTVCAEIDKTIYVAKKSFYKEKMKARSQ